IRRAHQEAFRDRLQAPGAQREPQRAARHDAVPAAAHDGSARPVLTAPARCATGAVHDVLRMMDYERIALPPDIKAIAPGTKLAGPVWTVSGHVDRTKSRDECLLGWCTLLAKAPRGHVVVCRSRDTDLVLAQGFPVFCAFLTPADIVERWVPDRFGEPVTIGEVT